MWLYTKPATENLPQKPTMRISYNYILSYQGILQPLSASVYDVDNISPYDVNLTLLIWDCACYRHAKILRRIIRIITCSKYNAPTELLSARHVIIMWPRDTWQWNQLRETGTKTDNTDNMVGINLPGPVNGVPWIYHKFNNRQHAWILIPRKTILQSNLWYKTHLSRW